MVSKCRKLYLDCRGSYKIPYFKIVHRDMDINNCYIVFASPKECVVARNTSISMVKRCRYDITREDGNVIIDEDCGGRSRMTYVYPEKVYDTVYKLYIEPMVNDEPPFTPGLMLIGSPGTGKSTLARVMSRIIGVSTFEVTPDTILSKYVGDSEKAIKRTISEAIRDQPSIVILDDAEWLLSTRNLSRMEESSNAFLNIKNILFNTMQEIYNKGYRVLFVASTNVKASEIDRAFLRQGRFGEPVFIPLPDYNAVKRVIAPIVGEDRAEDIAKRVVNMGLSIADAVGMAERVKRGLKVDYKPSSGRGYVRIHVEQIDYSRFFEHFNKDIFKGRARIYMHGNEEVMTSIATQISYNSGRTVVKLVDIRYYDEAVHTANMTNSNMIVSTTIPREVILYIMNNLDNTLFLVGKTPPQGLDVYVMPTLGILYGMIKRETVLKSLLAYKDIKVSDELVRKTLRTIEDSDMFTSLLDIIATLGYLDERIISNFKTYASNL